MTWDVTAYIMQALDRIRDQQDGLHDKMTSMESRLESVERWQQWLLSGARASIYFAVPILILLLNLAPEATVAAIKLGLASLTGAK